ncbi:MAG: peptide chain release factor 1 [Desulfobacterales bacterium]|nr:MAG: peptide chain release factor 1 [Desulfobacterales bacterium]
MLDKLQGVEERFRQVEALLSDPEIMKDREAFQKYAREHGELSKIVDVFREYRDVLRDLEDNEAFLREEDPELRELAREEIAFLAEKRGMLEADLKQLLIPGDPNDDKNVLLEIRAGTGGDEAALFAADLYRMYTRYAENCGWKMDVMTHHPTGAGGMKEIIVMISGRGAYSRLKFESGTHRVQRVPETEAQGRIHTSAVTVAVLPEAEDVEVSIDPSELKIDVYRSTGPGGQSVNTTDSAVRITHLPTSLVVTCQDEKSQHKNRAKALKVLRARLLDQMQREQNEKISRERKSQVGTGDRSGRIRTYNFPQGRVSDHRIGLTLYKLDQILTGDMDMIIDELVTHYQAESLRQSG